MSQSLLRVSAAALIFCAMIIGQVSAVRAQVFTPPAAQPNVGVQQAGGFAAKPQAGAIEQTGWGIPMPKITMPKLTLPKITMPKVGMPSMDAVTGPFKSGFSKVSSGTKKAWEGTKEMFSFGQNNTTANNGYGANSQQQSSFWHRLLVRDPEPQVPRTVGEFMRQPRIDQ